MSSATTTSMSEKEFFNDLVENFVKVHKLVDEESKNDPETEPYLSKYKAKEILINMRNSIMKRKDSAPIVDEMKLNAMLGIVLMDIGQIDMDTKDPSCKKYLTEAEEILSPNATRPETVITLLNVYNSLGVLWSDWDDYTKAKMYLLQAKELYESFKLTLQMPISRNRFLDSLDNSPLDDVKCFEKAHTLTLYYLAQVYGALKQDLKSAIYCHITLKRQLEYFDYDPIDWALNSATLSQFFAEKNGFFQSRHHLSAASTILDQYELELRASESNEETHLANLETFNHRSADVARCWAKYCLNLLATSKQRLLKDDDNEADLVTDMSNINLEDDENICGGDIKSLIFSNLDVSKYETRVVDKYLLTYQDAREVFLFCQTWLNKAKEYYKPDTLASDHIQLVQDSSQSYGYLAFFEEDDERRAKMLKRRIDMLEALVNDINPTYYMQYCRQLWYELGEVYSEILNIKLDKLNSGKESKPSPNALMKINHLCEKSIENYEQFLKSVKTQNGSFPAKLEPDYINPVISALAYIGRNSMKRIALDKSLQLEHVKKSYDSYKAVVDICVNDPNAATMLPEEFSLCKDMASVLPLKIKKLEAEMLAQTP